MLSNIGTAYFSSLVYHLNKNFEISTTELQNFANCFESTTTPENKLLALIYTVSFVSSQSSAYDIDQLESNWAKLVSVFGIEDIDTKEFLHFCFKTRYQIVHQKYEDAVEYLSTFLEFADSDRTAPIWFYKMSLIFRMLGLFSDDNLLIKLDEAGWGQTIIEQILNYAITYAADFRDFQSIMLIAS